MNDTYVFNMTDSATAMPSYYRGRQEKLTYLDTGFGDKNIYSTPEDLLKWDQCLYTNEILVKKSWKKRIRHTVMKNRESGIMDMDGE